MGDACEVTTYGGIEICLLLLLLLLLCRQTFSNRYFYIFSPILTKLGTHDLYVSTQKNSGTDCRRFDFKIFGEFLKKFKSAAELSRPTGIL